MTALLPIPPKRLLLVLAVSSLLTSNRRLPAADSAPSVAPPSVDSNSVALRWTASGTNANYVVQHRSEWGDDLWVSPRATFPWPTAETNWVDRSPRTNASGYYRVVAVPPVDRGHLVKAVSAGATVTRTYLQFLLGLLNVQLKLNYDVQVYRLDYLTLDAHGAPTTASGALVVPVGVTNALPVVSYQHGTLTKTNDAPSLNQSGEQYVGWVYAATGYLALLPDYLGLGDSPRPHPYHHASSEATAGVDFLRAARSFCATNHIAWNGQLFICGYSQGGHATAALQRELEEYHAAEFPLTASALMAGAYDLSGVTATDMLSDRAQPDPYYFAYLLSAYVDVYQFASSLADWLVPPYDTKLPPLFNGQTAGSDINAVMPAQPWKILKPEVLAAFKANPLHPLWVALRDNDLTHWTPQAPTRLYHCSGDLDVPPANSQVAHDAFASRGANVALIDPSPGADHSACAIPAMLASKAWFDSLKQP